MCSFPNLIDAHDQYDDGYETGVSDLLSGNKYKLPSLPPPSSSPYSSLSSSSMSTISTATAPPTTNLINPSQQQQSPSYMGGSSSGSLPPHMNQYQATNQAQQQHQFQQNSHQYPPLQHPSHQNSFNYHHMFNRMQGQQQQPLVKSEMSGSSEDPYRFVEDELGNNIGGIPPPNHPNSMSQGNNGPMHPHHSHHMSPAMTPNYSSAASSPMSMGPGPGSHMNHNQMSMSGSPQSNPMNPMMQYNDQHISHHHPHLMHHQQQNSQAHMNAHMVNGMPHQHQGHAPNNNVLGNETPKKRGRKKKARDENG